MDSDDESAIRALYVTAYPRLVSVVGVVSGSTAEAEEAVQEAFARLIGQWHRVRSYDDPEAWLRKAAFGIVSNRRRKVRNGLRALARLAPAESSPPSSGHAVDLTRALAQLPRKQREVIVLQHLGYDIAAIAAQLDIPAGTVKSRLSRARAALQPLLTDDLVTHESG